MRTHYRLLPIVGLCLLTLGLTLGTGVTNVSAQAPEIALVPANQTLSFPNTHVGVTSAALTFDIENTGNADLTITSLTLAGATPGEFTLLDSNSCSGAIISAGQKCVVDATFNPSVAGSAAAVVEIVSDDSDESFLLMSLIGNGTTPTTSIQVAPVAVTIPFTVIDEESATTDVTITNIGSSALTINSIQLKGTNKNQFALENEGACVAAIAATNTCTFQVKFAPTQEGSMIADIEIKSDDAINPTVQVPVVSYGLPKGTQIAITPRALTFPFTVLGNTTATKDITVTNTGTDDLTINSIQLKGTHKSQFAIENEGTCVGALSGGASCTFQAKFAPTREGSKVAQVRIKSDDALYGTIDVQLTSYGLPEPTQISVTPMAVRFPFTTIDQESGLENITIENTGTTPLTVSEIKLVGQHKNQFALSGDAACETAIAAGATCTFQAKFAPTREGSKFAQVQIRSDDPITPRLRVSLISYGLPEGSQISVSPAFVVRFATIEAGTESGLEDITITNNGLDDLNVTSIKLINPDRNQFELSGDAACETAIAPASSCTFQVKFTPTRAGAKASLVQIRSNDEVHKKVFVKVEGIASHPTAATTAEVAASPVLVAFGATQEGTESATEDVTIENVGAADLTINGISLRGLDKNDYAIEDLGACAIMPKVLAPGETCIVQVKFTPRNAGAKVTDLRIRTNDSDERTVLIRLAGNASFAPADPKPEIAVSTPGLFWNAIGIGTESDEQTVTIENVGADGLVINSIELKGTNRNQFIMENNTCAAPLDNGDFCTVDVKFTPSTVGGKVASLRIKSNDTDNRTVNVHLAAVASLLNGAVPDITTSDIVLHYGFGEVGTTSAAQTFVLTNDGIADLTISDIVKAGVSANEFNVSHNCATVAPAATCTISVTFEPLVEGSAFATLTVESNDPDEGELLLTLIGYGLVDNIFTGPQPEITVTPLSMDFTAAPTATKDVTITNDGTANLVLNGISVTDANNNFAIDSQTCAGSLAPAASCTVTIAYSGPNAAAEMATLDISSDDANESLLRIGLTTRGAPQANPLVGVFGGGAPKSGAANVEVFTVHNPGEEAFAFRNISLRGANAEAFLVENVDCEALLEPSATCSVEVAYVGAGLGMESAFLSFATDNLLNPVDVQVLGIGEPQISVSNEETTELPKQHRLDQNYPNPFNPVTTISYEVPETGAIRLAVYDMLGRQVALLVDDHVTAGSYQVLFDAANLSSGTYIYRLHTANRVLTQKMTLLK